MAGEPYEWREPNEDELKEIRERRARSDEISKIMSGYLLKGYRMLASHCNDCGVKKLLWQINNSKAVM